MHEFILEMTEEDYKKAGSKFVVFPPGAKVGDIEYRDVEIGMLDWDTPGQSMKVPVTVTESGADEGKDDKISFGVKVSEKGTSGIWKGKDIWKAVTGSDMPMKRGSDGRLHPAPDPMAMAGKPAVGVWQYQQGHPGGDKTQPPVMYPRLINILPPGSKPKAESLGI